MKHSRALNFLLILLVLISSNSLFGQNTEPKTRVLEPDHNVESKIMGKEYQLYISFPRGYSNENNTEYPVLYVLDGWVQFKSFSSAHKYMDFNDELEGVIIVGIGSGSDLASWLMNRIYDYTPSQDTSFASYMERVMGFPKGSIKTGGGAKFLECIKKEIIPFVDNHYKTTNDRGITGHSLGGLFTTYCLLNSSGVFTRYGINSPHLISNNNEVLNQAISQFTKNDAWDIPPTKVFVSVGGLEEEVVEEKDNALLMNKFCENLEKRNYKNIDLTWKIFDNETHLSVIPAMLSRTISVLYGKK